MCRQRSDIDVVVFGTGMDSEEPNAAALFHVSQAIMDSGMAKTPPTVISSARVPIIKFQEETTGIMVDVSFECGSALATTEVRKILAHLSRLFAFLKEIQLADQLCFLRFLGMTTWRCI